MSFHSFTVNKQLPSDLTRIALIRWSSLGDMVLCTSVLHSLKEQYKGAQVQLCWFCRPNLKAWLQHNFPDVLFVTHVQELLEFRPQLLVDLQKTWKSKLICFYLKRHIRAPYRSWSKHSWQRWWLTHQPKNRRNLRATYFSLPKYQALQQPVQTLNSHSQPDYKPGLKKSSLPIQKRLCLAPGAAFATKQAPLQVFMAIVEQITEQKGLEVLIVGGQSETKVCQSLAHTLTQKGFSVRDLSGQTSLLELQKILEESKVLLANDSGTAHIAEAVGTPVCVLFGPTAESFGFYPHLKHSRAFSYPLGCRPCSKHGSKPCRFGDQLCFHKINPDLVAKHVDRILSL